MRLVRRCLAAVVLTACLAGPAAATPTDRALELTRRYFSEIRAVSITRW